MIRRWLKAVGEGDPNAVLAASLVGLLVLSSPFAFTYGQKWLKVHRFDLGGEASRGTPPFRSYGEYLDHHTDLDDAHKIAALQFPDPRSCLEGNVAELSPESLKRLDWRKLETVPQADVCIFRLLSSGGGANYAAEWMAAQGLTLRVSTKASSEAYGVGSQTISGSWNIRENGYKHLTGGTYLHVLGPPHAMRVLSEWTVDGQSLHYVQVFFDIK
ncbi:MAG TPA: hypothetical protein VLA52_18585 [Thermohalobaculum sp.]|nr:hypothetical protein [Thermohalobaculum sp.]